MRHLAITVFLVAAGSAQAQSVTPFSTQGRETGFSVVRKGCDDCPPPKVKEPSYRIPVLKDGVQSVAVMEIDGEKKIVRTEHWMGGSPVLHISKVPEWMSAEQLQATVSTGGGRNVEPTVQAAAEQIGTIDFNSQTGAVENKTGATEGNTDAAEGRVPHFDDVPLRRK